MVFSTKKSLVGKIADYIGMNKSFHEYTELNIDSDENTIISPVEAKVINIDKIDQNGNLISKNGKEIRLNELIGNYANQFLGGKYINFYLSPSNKHFWVTPYNGMFTYTQMNEGKAIVPIYIGLENLFGKEMISKAVKKNASIGSVFQTTNYPLAMIAVGSLNVNRIHTDYEEMEYYKKGTPCGYFSIGSSVLFCFPGYLKILIDKGSNVRIGQKILI